MLHYVTNRLNLERYVIYERSLMKGSSETFFKMIISILFHHQIALHIKNDYKIGGID